jgi:hypothetical protein
MAVIEDTESPCPPFSPLFDVRPESKQDVDGRQVTPLHGGKYCVLPKAVARQRLIDDCPQFGISAEDFLYTLGVTIADGKLQSFGWAKLLLKNE